MKPKCLTPTDHIITAYPEFCSGSGWSNMPIWVVVQDQNKKIRLECIQPDEQTAEMRILFNCSHAAHMAMTNAVKVWRHKK